MCPGGEFANYFKSLVKTRTLTHTKAKPSKIPNVTFALSLLARNKTKTKNKNKKQKQKQKQKQTE